MKDDPRGPIRTILNVDKQPEAAYVTLSCGHTRPLNPIYNYLVGTSCHCFECGQLTSSRRTEAFL